MRKVNLITAGPDPIQTIHGSTSTMELTLWEKLNKGIVVFCYGKGKDGDVPRFAIGTRNREYIPNTRLTDKVVKELSDCSDRLLSSFERVLQNPELANDSDGFEYTTESFKSAMDKAFGETGKEPTVGEAAESESITYYDFESRGFRKFKLENLMYIVEG